MSESFLSWPGSYEMLVILGMVLATYSTRLIGWLVLRNRTVSPALQRMLDASPACVMLAIVAPSFMTTDPIDLFTLTSAIVVALRTNMPTTVIYAVVINGLLHHLF